MKKLLVLFLLISSVLSAQISIDPNFDSGAVRLNGTNISSESFRTNLGIPYHNKISVASDGATNIPGTFTHDYVWEDLRFAASAINPQGGATNAATLNTEDATLTFPDGNAATAIGIVAQLPHSWKAGSSIVAHIHSMNTSATLSGNGRWRIDYKIANVFGNFPGNWESETISAAYTAGTATHKLNDFTPINMTGYRHSSCMLIRVLRLADTDVLDTLEADIKLLEFDIHYLSNRPGSTGEHGDAN